MGSRIEGRDHLTAVKRYSRCCFKYDYTNFLPKKWTAYFSWWCMFGMSFIVSFRAQDSWPLRRNRPSTKHRALWSKVSLSQSWEQSKCVSSPPSGISCRSAVFWEVHSGRAAELLGLHKVIMWVVVKPRDYYCGMLVYFGVYGTDLLWVLIVTECEISQVGPLYPLPYYRWARRRYTAWGGFQ